MHQPLGPDFSYLLQGGLVDHRGTAREGEMGLDLEDATRSAIAYAPTLAASRLEAPVIHPSEDSVRSETLHTGARTGGIVNDAPEVMPHILVPLDALPWQGTTLAGLQRRLVFDYRQTAFVRRNALLRLLPDTRLPAFETTVPLDLFVIGGDLGVSGERVGAGGFLVVDEGHGPRWGRNTAASASPGRRGPCAGSIARGRTRSGSEGAEPRLERLGLLGAHGEASRARLDEPDQPRPGASPLP